MKTTKNRALLKGTLIITIGFFLLYLFTGCTTAEYLDNGNKAINASNNERAITQFTNAIRVSKDDWDLAESYNRRGELYFRMGKHEQAISDFSKIIEIGLRKNDLKKGIGYIERGNVYFALKKYEQALDDFSKYIKYNINDPIGYTNRGNVYYVENNINLSKKDYDKAIELYNLATQADPVMKPSVFESWISAINKYREYFRTLPNMNNQVKLIIASKSPGNILVNRINGQYVSWNDCVVNISPGLYAIAVYYSWDPRFTKKDVSWADVSFDSELGYVKKESPNPSLSQPPPTQKGSIHSGSHIVGEPITFTRTITENFVAGNIYEIIYSDINNNGVPDNFVIKKIDITEKMVTVPPLSDVEKAAQATGNLPDDYFELIDSTAFRIVRGRDAPPNEVHIPAYHLYNGEYLPVTEIGRSTDKSSSLGVFSNRTNVTAILIPDTIITIRNFSFDNCTNLISITIPASVETIDYFAFLGCRSLASINVDVNNNNYASNDGALYNKNITELIIYPGSRSEVTLPASVTSIGRNAFYSNKNITEFTIPENVTSIGAQAFEGTSLTSIIIHGRITEIDPLAFYITNLTSVTFQDIIPIVTSQNQIYLFGLSYSFSRSITDKSFPGDLYYKYEAGGSGTYTRDRGSDTWTKQ